ncbi:hypothetical protein [Actinoplanes sp. TBRC 11911]|uniref:hypothetical protein n=1 Tax=Actinoplanes sp. TBRC 11911 TaxID=2729386 RepID=UPI0020071D7F|nr:hypothetical protein [Actinoplanes sp. TBRC 11911]
MIFAGDGDASDDECGDNGGDEGGDNGGDEGGDNGGDADDLDGAERGPDHTPGDAAEPQAERTKQAVKAINRRNATRT